MLRRQPSLEHAVISHLVIISQKFGNVCQNGRAAVSDRRLDSYGEETGSEPVIARSPPAHCQLAAARSGPYSDAP